MDNVYEKAVSFAEKVHEGQLRKDGSKYILHPLEAAEIAGTMTDDPYVLSAAVLHDTVEDTPVTIEEIRENFGEKIAQLVEHETENKRPEMNASDSWKIRKVESLEVLKNSGVETKILWVSDKLSNMRSLKREFDLLGAKVFDLFNQNDPKEQRWYHKTVLDYTKDLSEYPAYKEYESLVHQVFDEVI